MKTKNIKKIFIFFTAFFLLPYFFIFAQNENLEDLCESIEKIEKKCESFASGDCKKLLESCAQYLDEKSERISQDISKTEKQKKTLQNQISILKQKINKLETQIKQSNIMIQDLSLQIRDTESSISKTSQKIEEKKKQLVEILRITYEMDKKSLIEVLLTEQTISGFFDSLIYLETLNAKSQDLLNIIKNLKNSLEDQKLILDKEKENLERVLKMQVLQKEESEKTKKETEQLSKLTEAQYQKLIQEKKEVEQVAAKIKAKIFELIGVAKAPTFGEALEIAKAVGGITNIRPAFLLAIISQESAIGRNVGQCYLTDENTGDGIKIATGEKSPRTMNPYRDVPIFLDITKKLGLNYKSTPVSCWIPIYVSGKPYGWGGAMGPAQFIPSTWRLYEPDISQRLGRTPNPWLVYDSFLAAAIYLADLGANAQTTQSERNAANKYCGGYSWYSSQVMERADCIQTFIDKGTMSDYCQNLIGLR